MNNESKQEEWARCFMERFLDLSHLISLKVLQEKRWLTTPVPDILNPMEAEWLVDAIRSRGVLEVVGIAFEHEGNPDVNIIPVTQDALLYYNGSNSWRTVIITSTNEEFVYYKDEANRYFLLCGDEAFLSQSYRCSLTTAKTMYMDWIDLEHHSKEEKRFLREIWNRYVCRD